MNITEFQDRIAVTFADADLLQQALTHRSYVNEHYDEDIADNERLEFLGDAILDYVTADWLFRRYPDMSEGVMTRLRAMLVRTESLAQLALACDIDTAMIIGKGEEASGGREKTSTLCQVFEAVVGAIYLDQGLEAARAFILPRLTELEPQVMEEAILKDSRSQFQEWSQARFNITPEYELIEISGPEHEQDFVVEVLVGPKIVASGSGKNKQSAAQSAARAALDLIDSGEIDAIFPPDDPFDMDAEQ